MSNVAIVTDFDAKNDINPNDYSNPLQQKKFLLIEMMFLKQNDQVQDLELMVNHVEKLCPN